MNNSTLRCALDAALYLFVFILIEALLTLASTHLLRDSGHPEAPVIVSSAVSAAVTTALFAWRRWTPMSRQYIDGAHWDVLAWAVCLAIGLLLPAQGLQDLLGAKLSPQLEQTLRLAMSSDWGLLAIGILAPVAEETVFRGAILRRLLTDGTPRTRWTAITVSALAFAVVHGNLAQGTNAFVMGLILGWLYCRTGSIAPGVALHCANNLAAIAVFRLLPQAQDMTLLQLYGGDWLRVALAIACSLAISLAAVYQLVTRTRGHSRTGRRD